MSNVHATSKPQIDDNVRKLESIKIVTVLMIKTAKRKNVPGSSSFDGEFDEKVRDSG